MNRWLVFAAQVLVVAGGPVAWSQPVRQVEPLGLIESVGELPSAAPQLPADPGESVLPLPAPERLLLADVIASVYRNYPLIQQARLEAGVAGGQQVSAMGAYDLQLQATSLSEPTGFYRNYRQALGVVRQTWWGGHLSAGYRTGRGDFAPWYKERETNKGGEFSLGLGLPLLQGRAIDPQRVAVFQAGLAQQSVGPLVQVAILDHSRQAAALYWEWVAAGSRLAAQDELLNLARVRQQQFEEGAAAGKFAQIDVVFNRQLVAERANKRLAALEVYRAAGIRLSLFLRDEVGAVLVPDDPWLPHHFPTIDQLPPADFNTDFQAALVRRPELQLLSLESRQVQLDRQWADNQRLPTLDLLAEASQDVGLPVNSPDDKGPFELLVGVQSQVPIQRRQAIGKVQQTTAKLSPDRAENPLAARPDCRGTAPGLQRADHQRTARGADGHRAPRRL